MRIFVTGATGYIGGTIATHLHQAGHHVRGLTRSTEKAAALRQLGIDPVVGTLDDAGLLAAEATAADAVINAADSDHGDAVDALLDALTGSGKPFLHTSGSSIVGDDARGQAGGTVATEATVAPGSGWSPTPDKAARVAIDRRVLTGAERGIRTAVICPTLIYGHGRGLHRDSIQLPALADQARRSGVVRHVGPGHNVWSTVHVDDLADLYARALEHAPAGAFFFAENGESSFGDLAQAIADTLGLGRAQPWSVEDAVAEWGDERATYALGSNSRVRGHTARTLLGWSPTHTSAVDWIRTAGQPV